MNKQRKSHAAHTHTRFGLAALACAGAIALAANVRAADSDLDTPPELIGVGITENLGQNIPLDIAFRDSAGVRVTFRDLLSDGKPAIITPVFFECPMLCTEVLNGLVAGLNELDMKAGDEFNIITYSFNPDEGPELAAEKRKGYLSMYENVANKSGWRFLTGDQDSISAMNDALGFHVRRTENGQYAHSAAIMFVTPDGRIARYVNNVVFAERDLRLALVEASEGKIGTPMDKFLLFTCYQYDPESGSFGPSAWKLMRAGGLATVILLGGFLSFMWIKDSLKHKHAEPTAGMPADEDGSGAKHAG